MIEVQGNVWDYKADVVLIPINGDINKKGRAVMGRGVAYQAQQRYVHLNQALALHLEKFGNTVGMLMWETLVGGRQLWSFPVKHHWREMADLNLIAHSTGKLREVAQLSPKKIYVLPRPGCGNGQLTWELVRDIVCHLPDNVHIIDL